MSSRKLVKNTLEFRSPCRVPRQLWLLPWAQEYYPEEVKKIQTDFPDDIVNVPVSYKKQPKTIGDPYAPGVFIDEWGCVFKNRQKGIIGEVKQPLLKEWGDVWTKLKSPNNYYV